MSILLDMIPPNADRNQRIYRLWERGYTIDQAAAELPDIPRSTIGYYYRKFNQYAKEGRPIIIPQRTQDRQKRSKEALDSGVAKSAGFACVLKSLHSREEAEYTYYLLGVIKMMKELNLIATPEESKALRENMVEAIIASQNATKIPAQTMPQVADAASKQGRSLEEIITEFQKLSLLFKEWPKSQNQQQQQERQTG